MFTAEVFANLFSMQALFGLILGTIGGVFLGVIPGLGATMGVAMVLPITFGMEPAAALIMLTALYTAALYGGSITAILLHTPGTPANAATCLDGYQLALQGKGLHAIGAATVGSVIGGTFGALVLLFLAPPLARAALAFSAPEFFLLAIFGLTVMGSLASDNKMLKGLMAGALGLIISTIGIDEIYGVRRFTYGITALESGITVVPALIGLFSISQVLIWAEAIGKKGGSDRILPNLTGKLMPPRSEVIRQLPNLARSSIIGTIIGIIPGPGPDIAGWVGYNEAKRFSKNRDQFGKGSIEAVYAAESANNATAGGSLVPLMALGVPASAAAAVLLGGMFMHGLIPGHGLFTVQGDVTYAILHGKVIVNILMGVVGLLIAKHAVKAARAPVTVLAPVVVVLTLVGCYALRFNFIDITIMSVFGILGYLMRKTGFTTAPVVLGIILGAMAENGFKRSLIMARGENLLTFYLGRPVSVVLIVLIVISLFTPLIMKQISNLQKKKMEKAA